MNKKDILRILKLVNKNNKLVLPLIVIKSLLNAAVMYLGMFFGSVIIDKLISYAKDKSVTFDDILNDIIILTMIIVIIPIITWALDKYLIIKLREVAGIIDRELVHKQMVLDYQVFEKSDTLNMLQEISQGTNSNGNISNFCNVISFATTSFANIIYSIVILSTFFILSGVETILLIPLIIIVLYLNKKISDKINNISYDFFKENVKGNREFSYYFKFLHSKELGKDVRIYNMQDMIDKTMEIRSDKLWVFFISSTKKALIYEKIADVIRIIFLVSIYSFIGYSAINGVISIGQVTLYIAALTQFMESLNTLMQNYSFLKIQSKYLKNYHMFLEIENEKYDGTLPIEKRLDNEYELEFKNVSFHYPNSDELILKNVNTKIKVGKKLAIVGQNGAGKSTFIKLLCRLYDPTEGEILLNGIDIRKYDYDEYMKIFSVVFQDFNLFGYTIAENIAVDTEFDEEKVLNCLEEVGMRERVEKMDNGINSYLYKSVEEGIEISGGEAQKIAIARALYKDSPIVIMDEPTAALDPLSELEIYENFNKMVEDKTAIYISHRMSSCKFCNNIIVFEDGNIVQKGTHKELLEDAKGLYHKLWDAQAQYYTV